MLKSALIVLVILAAVFVNVNCRPPDDLFSSILDDDDDFGLINTKIDPGLGSKSGTILSQETVCINGKCKSKTQNCSGKNCKTSYNHNVNINSLKTLGFKNHGFHGGFGSGFISKLFKWDPFESMGGLFSNIFGEQKRSQKETQAQVIRRLGQQI